MLLIDIWIVFCFFVMLLICVQVTSCDKALRVYRPISLISLPLLNTVALIYLQIQTLNNIYILGPGKKTGVQIRTSMILERDQNDGSNCNVMPRQIIATKLPEVSSSAGRNEEECMPINTISSKPATRCITGNFDGLVQRPPKRRCIIPARK